MYQKKSTFFVFLSAVLYSLGGLFYKIIPWDALAINCGRVTLAGIVLLLYMKFSGRKFTVNKTVVLAAISMVITNNLYSLSYKLTTAGNAIILQFTMPVFVVLIMLVLYHRKPGKDELITCALVFGGIVLFFVDSLSAGNMLGNLLAVISGVSYAFFFVFNGREDANPLSAIILSHCCSALIGLPALLKTDVKGSSAGVIAALLALAFLQQAAAGICFSEGISGTPAVAASLISGVEPILNPILVAVFWHEMLTPLSFAGAAIVLISIMVYNYRRAKTPANG